MKYYKLAKRNDFQSLFGIREKDNTMYFLFDGKWEPWGASVSESILLSSGYQETTLKYLKLRGVPSYESV